MDYGLRYSRQIMLPEIGEDGQKRLSKAGALIVGLGGLGSPVALYLTGAGIGRIGLCDADTVSLSNLQRQVLYSETELSFPKTECAANRLKAMSGQTRFDIHPAGLTPENAAEIITPYDIVVDCCDNFATRYLIDDICHSLGKTWIYGTISGFHGQCAVMNGKHHKRYRDLYPDQAALSAKPTATAGVLGAVPGIVGAIQAAEAIKTLLSIDGTLDGRLLTANILNMTFDILTF